MELDDNSPIIGQPGTIVKPLTKYQKAILYKCLKIESEKKTYGFMGDIPGTGKTASILALVCAGKIINSKDQTIIVVPQNIISQWESEITKFCGDSLKYVSIKEYSQIRDLYNPGEIDYYKTFDVLLITSILYQNLLAILKDKSYFIKRVVFDEVDTLENIFDSISIEKERNKKGSLYAKTEAEIEQKRIKDNLSIHDITWYVSASVCNLFDEENNIVIGDLFISKKEFTEHYVKCKKEFLEKYSILKYKYKQIDIHCKSFIEPFSDLLSVEQFDNINSLSFNKIRGTYISKCATSEKDVILVIVEDYINQCRNIKSNIQNKKNHIEKLIKRNLDHSELDNLLLIDEKEYSLLADLLKRYFNLIDCELKEDLDESFRKFKESYNKKVELFDFSKTKYYQVLSYINEKIKTNQHKTIIFSDYTDGFNRIISYFDNNSIKYTDLAKGNVKEITEAIYNFKKGDTNFLLIDSASEGCGLNLENTTNILFLHRTAETLKDQMIGRAFRPGRTCDLEVNYLLNENEVV